MGFTRIKVKSANEQEMIAYLINLAEELFYTESALDHQIDLHIQAIQAHLVESVYE